MKLEFFIDSNNITYTEGDTIRVDFTGTFTYIKSITDIQFVINPIESWDQGHDIYIRWSYDIINATRASLSLGNPRIVWSAWTQITDGGKPVSGIDDIYSKIIRQDPDSFDLQFKFVRRGTSNGARSINRIEIYYEPGKIPESPEALPYPMNQDSCKAKASPGSNFSTGILVSNTDSLFRPYDIMKPAQAIYQQMACATNEMFGHVVRYFKTRPTSNSGDPVLHEYSLFEVYDVKDIKMAIPDNSFPDNADKYTPMDMEFAEGIEGHITREHFERAFGVNGIPEEKDYIYFPLIDRIYEVTSAYMFRDFMGMEAYYKIMLYKWADKLNVMRENPDIDKYVTDLHESFETTLQPAVEKEYLRVTKPSQYTTVAIGGYDYVRSHVNSSLVIQAKTLQNYYTIISKHYYDLKTGMNFGDIAVKYKKLVNILKKDNFAFTAWIKLNHSALDKNSYDVILDGLSNSNGIQIKVNYTGLAATSISVIINNAEYVFTNLPTLSNDIWYGIVFNLQPEFKQLSFYIWGIKFDESNPTQNRTTNLLQIYNKTLDYTPVDILPTETPYQLKAGTLNLTNIRIWSEPIEEEQQSLILNQYVVKEQELALVIDNAIPPIKLEHSFVR
jgi:hypothetical protein